MCMCTCMPWRSLRLAGLSPDWTNVHVHMYASDSVRTGFPQNRDEVASNWQVFVRSFKMMVGSHLPLTPDHTTVALGVGAAQLPAVTANEVG